MNGVLAPSKRTTLVISAPSIRSVLAIVGILAILLVSSLTLGLGTLPRAAIAPSTHAVAAVAPIAPSRSLAPHLSAAAIARENAILPGSVPTGASFTNTPSLAAIHARALSNVSTALAQYNLTHLAAAPTSKAAPLPLSTTFATGTFVGYVNQTEAPYRGIASASVAAFSLAGAYCPAQTCTTVATNASGFFTVTCPAGQDYVQASTSFRVTNLTFATCQQGMSVYVGTIFLIQTAFVTATVVGDDATHQHVAGVQVCATSRDGSVLGNPCGTTDIYGSLNKSIVAVPPIPSRIDFSPPPGYLSNFTYVNATPGQSLYLGVILLERLVAVRAELYDAVTQSPIGTQASLTVCASLTAACQTQGQLGGSTVEAFGPPGVDYVQVAALGYVQDTHSIGLVPKLGPGKIFDVGRIYLMPLGAFNLHVGITVNASHPNYPWGTGQAVVSATSLDGYQMVGLNCPPFGFGCNTTVTTTAVLGCQNVGTTVQYFAAPLRVSVSITPETTPICNFAPSWPIPGMLPVWSNTTLLNLTPRSAITGAIELDFTPGTYMAGNVTSPQHSIGLPTYQVTAQSTTDPTLTQYPYTFGPGQTSPWLCGSRPISQPSGTYGHTFCAPVPPGPVRLTATANGFETNYTWAATQQLCCNSSQEPMPLGSANLQHFTTINLTGPGSIWGHVYRGNNTTLGVTFGSFQVCSASANPNLGCWTGAVNADGSFYSPAPLGWDWIRVSASGFSPNLEWVFVVSNSSIGNITLTPLATLYGQVVDANGVGITAASIQTCVIDTALAGGCNSFGAGLTSTDGHYLGTIVGGWLPWTTFRIVASASGFTSDWAWANATAGVETQVPTIVLHEIGTNSTAAPQGGVRATSGSASKSYGVWVDGRFIDNYTSWSVVPSTIQACPTNGGPCTLFSDGANPGGYFNGSVDSGLYNLTATLEGYYSISIPFNATNHAFLHLGTIPMVPYGFVNGQVAIDPWNQIVVRSSSRAYVFSMAPGADATGCDNSGTICGAAIGVDSLGYYNVSAPYGVYDTVRVTGLYIGGGPSAPGGVTSNSTSFNSTGFFTNLNFTQAVQLPIFGAVYGLVRDNSTYNPNLDMTRLPVRWASVTENTIGVAAASVGTSAGGGGQYTILIPPGNTNGSIYLSAILPLAFYQSSVRVYGVMAPAGLLAVPLLNLTPYGWLNAQLTDPTTGQGVGFVGGSANFTDVKAGITYFTNGAANGGGFLNMSAPIGARVLFHAGPGLDYNVSRNYTIAVNESSTAFVNATGPLDLGAVDLAPWGWIRSAQVNSSVQPVITTIIDKLNGMPLPFASVTVASTDPTLAGSSQDSNWQGQFLSDAPIGPRDTLQIVKAGYVANFTLWNVHPGQTLNVTTVNLTADGVLAGMVVGFPSEQPIAGAIVTACPPSSLSCTSGVSNSSGLFWVNAAPGLEDITIDAPGYVSNTSIVAQAQSDKWVWMGTQVLNQFAYVYGVVRGLPSGLPVQGATVSVCSTLGFPTGPCGFFVTTTASGGFLLTAPPGSYILKANDTDFNSSYLPLFLAPGQLVNVGVLFLAQFGALVGTVVSATTLAPIASAQVVACPTWSGDPCLPQSNTSASGRFVLHGAPGPYVLSISAAGFADAFLPVRIVSGITVSLFNIQLEPLSTALPYPVSGQVVDTATGLPLAGAVVAAILNGSPASSTVTDASGSFSFIVLYGTYTLTVSLPGYAPSSLPLVVHQGVSNILVSLTVMTYPILGIVTDGLSHNPLVGVAITEDNNPIGTTDTSGVYRISLANGTHTLVATAPSTGAVSYTALTFVLIVNGIGYEHDLTLYPPSANVFGLVVDHVTGLPVPDATIVISGETVENLPFSTTVVSNPVGQFNLVLPQGTYTVTATASGYTPVSGSLSTGSSTTSGTLTVKMVPTYTAPTTNSGGGSNSVLWAWIAVGAVIGAVAAFAVVTTRRRRKSARAEAPPKPSSGGPRS